MELNPKFYSCSFLSESCEPFVLVICVTVEARRMNPDTANLVKSSILTKQHEPKLSDATRSSPSEDGGQGETEIFIRLLGVIQERRYLCSCLLRLL